MEGLVDAGRECASGLVSAALATEVAQEECRKLGRYCIKLNLVLTELQLVLRDNEPLRGSKTAFLAVDATVSALRQAEQLVTQCAATNPSSIWPLEDSVEFEAVAAELRGAAGGLAALGGRLPQDVQQDAAHVFQQFLHLSFTQGELSETEEVELERVQHHNSTTPRKAAAPPAAPPDQYASPGAALASGAMAASVLAAARARAPAPLPSAADVQQQVEQRQALAQAAAVAHEAAVGVLPEGEGEGEGPEGPPGEDDSLMQQEIEEEVAEAAAAAAAPVVLTPAGEIALAPEAPAKGAVPSRGATPLPPDPFEMVGGADEAQLASNTIHELRGFRREQGDLAVADEAVRQLEATNDLEALSLQEQQAREASGAAEKLAALRQLQEYEAAMEEGEAAEAAVQGDAAPAPPLHKSRSQQAAAVLESNLAGLASEWGGSSSMEGPTAASPKDAVPAAPEPAGEAA